eukprot:TRINITY_DN6196_c0_g1_i7.p2 TRINITY_DN6196_c0_g1~~TRINITY_DN6196_c0_g1_i7.p2  ORF type:complete len:219 (-),score=-16.16 TRINITY_DN6196_c0_g1_i7:531-1187(-)
MVPSRCNIYECEYSHVCYIIVNDILKFFRDYNDVLDVEQSHVYLCSFIRICMHILCWILAPSLLHTYVCTLYKLTTIMYKYTCTLYMYFMLYSFDLRDMFYRMLFKSSSLYQQLYKPAYEIVDIPYLFQVYINRLKEHCQGSFQLSNLRGQKSAQLKFQPCKRIDTFQNLVQFSTLNAISVLIILLRVLFLEGKGQIIIYSQIYREISRLVQIYMLIY